MLNDLVSIIIPAYNAEKQIGEALTSVFKQTYPYFEVIVVDDASKDQTTEVVESFTDERLRLLRHSTNQGPGAARNSAIEAAKGKWIALLDADDQWHFSRLEKLMQVIADAGEGFFIADDSLLCFETDEGLKPWGSLFDIHHKILFDNKVIELNLVDYLKFRSPLIHPIIPLAHIRAYSLKYNPISFMGEDLEMYCHLFRTGLKLRLIYEPLYMYRMTLHSLSASKNRFEHLEGVYQCLLIDDGFSDTERRLFKKHLQRVQRNKRYEPFVLALKEKKFGRAWQLMKRAPWLSLEFAYRLLKSLRYRVTALKYRGKVK